MRPCATPGCSALVKLGKCDRCRVKSKPERDDRRSASARGYDSTWERFRVLFLCRHPLCEDCLEHGETTPTAEVHHMAKVADRPDLRLVEGNCRTLCKACHSRRTARGE